MNTKEYLSQIRSLDLKINQKIEEKETLYSKVTSTGSQGMNPDKIQSSINLHKSEDIITKYIDLEHEIDNLIDEFVDLKDKIINEIHQLKDYRHIDVLYQRYVQYHSFELIAVNMGYTIRRVYQLHGDALQEFQKVLQFISVNNEL